MFAECDEGNEAGGMARVGLGVSRGHSFKSWATGTQKALPGRK